MSRIYGFAMTTKSLDTVLKLHTFGYLASMGLKYHDRFVVTHSFIVIQLVHVHVLIN